ncbi:MAG: spermidine/putrescine ABC transporter substrate-binding protein [Thiogranum sp.]
MNTRTAVAILLSTLVLLLQLAHAPWAAAAAPPASPRTLVLLNWSDYIDPALVEKFEARFNAKVSEVFFESDDQRDDMMLETDGAGYDVVLVNGSSVDDYRKRGWLAPLGRSTIENIKYVDPQWVDAFPASRGYAVPYFWGTMGIAYRTDLVEQPPTSWMDLLKPAEYLRHRVSMIGSARDLFTSALKGLGYSANSDNPADINAAEHLLLAQKPYVRTYSYLALNETSALVSGDVIAAMMYNGDALMVHEYNDKIVYVLPKEGGNIWVDYLAVMESSKNKDLAWALINFLNEPENAAQLAQFVYYATPNQAAEKLLPPEFLSNPVIYPGKQALDKSEFYTALPPRALKQRNIAATRVVQ